MPPPAKRPAPFPAFLKLNGLHCLMIGGHGEAPQKAEALLKAGAILTIVAPKLSPELAALWPKWRAKWLQEHFKPHHLDGIWLVVSSLTDQETNARIYAEALGRNTFINVVDQPRFCNVIWPARVERSPISIAISTGGASPALAAHLKRQISDILPEQLGPFADWLAAARKRTSPLLPNLAARGHFWRALLENGLAEKYLAGEIQQAETMIQEALQQQAWK
ncbi:MAG: bifunctional precorrin-2 dehydrogenase/sirohydrochlorin ferrochelatase [Magnetococcales bacterium]|nr:bifunctional precorrin-2 dehydrogenase/sirohydrochlorin ferrochelatase [Magnetococcales bacterium]